MTAKAQEFGASAATKSNEAATVVGEKIGSLATVIRENAPQEGAMGTAATVVVDGLESASSYLREKKFEHLAKDVRCSGPRLSCPISTDWRWHWIFTGATPEVKHGQRIATALRAQLRIVARRHR
jgi:hypothetical protein